MADAAATSSAPCLRVLDYRGLTQLSPEQEHQLDAYRAAAAAATAGATAHSSALAPTARLSSGFDTPRVVGSSALAPTARLSSGFDIPLIGLGTWKASPGQVRAAVLAAVRCGYRSVDCASIYANEHEVGAALTQLIAEGTVQRSELFITTKLWNSDHACVEAACRRSLAALKLDYLDLFLIHWPVVTGCTGPELVPSTAATWAAMEQLVDRGLVRSIGMSNFSRMKLAGLLKNGARIRPAVLQVEAHPFFPNSSLIEWARSQGLHVTAYSPLGSPDSAAIMRRGPDIRKLLEEPLVLQLAEQHGKSPAQVLIRWALDRGCSVLPKSTNADRIAANLAVLDWQLAAADVECLAQLPYKRRMVDGNMFLDAAGPYKTLQDLWDEADEA